MAAGSLEFLVNIQQKMTGGNIAADLATLEGKITSEAKALAVLESWMKRTSGAAGEGSAKFQRNAAAIEATQAKIEAQTSVLQKLESTMKGLNSVSTSGAAKFVKTAEAIEATKEKIEAQTKALQKLEAAQKRMHASTDMAEYTKVKGLIDAKKQSLASLSEQLVNTGAAEGQAGAGAANLGEKLSELAGGPVGKIVGALIALITVLVVAGVKLTAFALQAADAARSFRLVLEGAAGSAKAAADMDAAVNRVAGSTSILQPELEHMAQTLAVVGLKGKLFEQTLKTMAAVASVAGPQAAGKLEEIAKKVAGLGHFEIGGDSLAGLGISMEDLARSMGVSLDKLKADMKAGTISVEDGISAMNKALNTRFGAVAAKQALGFTVQIAKLQENLGKLFKNVDLEPFLKALHEVLSVFDQQTSSGKALAYVLSTAFSGLFKLLANFGPLATAGLKQLIITGLKLYIVFAPVSRELVNFSAGLGKSSSAATVAFSAFSQLGFLFTTLLGGPIALLGWIDRVIQVIGDFFGIKIPSLLDIFSSIMTGEVPDFSSITKSIGANLVQGLIDGVTGNAAAFLGSLTGMVSGGIDAVKSILGIASPSKVFAKIGNQTVEGFTGSVDAGADDAQASMTAMVAPPSGEGGSAPAAARGSASGNTINVYITGSGAEDIWEQLEERVTALFEGLSLSGPEPSPAGAS